MSVRLSARDNSAPSGRIFMKFDIWGFFGNIGKLENSSLTEIGQEQRVLYMKTYMHFCHISFISSEKEKCFRQKF
jgi:hypothetical protein